MIVKRTQSCPGAQYDQGAWQLFPGYRKRRFSIMDTSNIRYQICTLEEKDMVVDFLMSVGEELALTKRSEAAEITNLLFAKGGAMISCLNSEVVAMLGYFLGEPTQSYANKEVGFIYVTAIAKPYRLSPLMWNGMNFAVRQLRTMGVKEIRCHAREHDRYTNRLYAHFARPLRKERNRRGTPCILYGNSADNILAYMERRGTSPT
ncbi:MAG: hypothetical protein R3A44_05170 [Caldilineaceae bacterium]